MTWLSGLLLLLGNFADSSGMAAVPGETGFCGRLEDTSAMCYEWAFSAHPRVRFVAYGYEDGIQYGFYSLNSEGTYEHILRIYPVIRDSSQKNGLFWGYPWDIQDIVLVGEEGQQKIFATFEHHISDDGDVCSPAWQAHVPAVLFIGRTTQPEAKVPWLDFMPSALHGLRSAAEAEDLRKP